jgi:predicted nucleotidyltransferase
VGADIEAVIVFGSVARGEASEGSDIDLAVVSDILRDGFAIIGSVPRTTDGAT